MKNLLQEYLIKFKNNELSMDEIKALRFAEEGSDEKEIFWELQEIARQKKEEDDFLRQMKYQSNLMKGES
ncbi:MAG: hypothetical protein V3S72_08595 [Desulfobacterales bacterium]